MPLDDCDTHSEVPLQSLPVAAAIVDRDGRVLAANPAAAALFGAAQAADLTGTPWTDLVVGPSGEEPTGEWPGVLAGRPDQAREAMLKRTEGGYRHVAIDAAPVPSGEAVLLVLRDITAQRLTEQRFTRSQAFANIGTWDWNTQTGELFWSERIASLFGYGPGERETTYANFLNAVHPDDRQRVVDAVNACIENGSAYNLEHRVVWPDGSVRWVLERGDVVRNAEGRPLNMLGVVQDITERKRQEAALELAGKVIENTPEGVLVTDARLNIISVNHAFISTTGYSELEVLGHKPSILASGRHGADFYQMMWQSLRDSGQWQGEIWNRRKNGDIYPEWLNISAIRDETGAVTHYAGIFSDLSTQEHVRKRLHRLAYYDLLTDLPNRDLFRDRLANAVSRSRRLDRGVGLIFLGLDRFKTVNDSLGHSAGDELLKAVAERLVECMGESDTIARLGGDEFTVVLGDIAAPTDVAQAARKILQAFRAPNLVEGHEIYVGASIGISVFPGDGDTPEELIRNAEAAMYKAKEQGRNDYRFYTADMGTRSAERLVLESELRKAIERNELSLAFQPQVDLKTGRICGVEALARWHNARLGRVRPDLFIEAAETTGVIAELGRWVLDAALRTLSRWHQAGFSSLRMAVNISGHQLLSGCLVDEVQGALARHGVPAASLELELTESVLMENAERTVRLLERLQALGLSLAVDDFGTGYSSLAYLKRFDVDKLKIDKSFVRDIPGNNSDAEIAATVIAMGHKLGLRIVAEGVETPEQLRFLAEQGCDQIQGYLFSPPVEAPALLELLEKQTELELPA